MTAAAVLCLVAGCSEDTDTGGTEGAAPPTGADAEGSLVGICPDPVVIQTNWFPQAMDAPLFELIGTDGRVDGAAGRYSGVPEGAGVTVEVRSGGPYLGNQSVSALMYQDDDILLGTVDQDSAIKTFGTTPTVGVMAAWERRPVSLTFDPASFDFDSIDDIGRSDATVLYFAGTPFVDYLVANGMLRADQLDNSYDGTLSRFVADPGGVVIHSVVTNEPWRLENEVEAWGGRRVASLLLDDAGFEIYQQLASRPEAIETESDCLAALVPMIQQASVDYLADPTATNEKMIEIVTEFDSFWTLSPELQEFAYDQIIENGFIGNGPDDTLGNFDLDRVGRMVDELKPIYAAEYVDSFDPAVTVDQLVTNEFIDPSIGTE